MGEVNSSTKKPSDRDPLGTRMKEQYEFRTRQLLPRRTYTIVRLDGKAFHSYTRGLQRPYDQQLSDDMAEVALFLCQQVSGTKLAYTQSDEISLLLTDFASPQTEAYFDGSIQKITSVSASLATAKFNELRPGKLAFFDSRAFSIPDRTEVINYFIWRQRDATRNSVSMAAQAHFSHRSLQGKSTNQMQELLFAEHGINWNDYPESFKRGTVVSQITEVSDLTYTDRRTGEEHTKPAVERRRWVSSAPPIFTPDGWLHANIPVLGA
jgi:tRNA(His) guanylyltransferase